jgi:hypothetical protein
VDCASKGASATRMGVGAAVGFAGETEACWHSAEPAPETKARITHKPIRITRCILAKLEFFSGGAPRS